MGAPGPPALADALRLFWRDRVSFGAGRGHPAGRGWHPGTGTREGVGFAEVQGEGASGLGAHARDRAVEHAPPVFPAEFQRAFADRSCKSADGPSAGWAEAEDAKVCLGQRRRPRECAAEPERAQAGHGVP